MKLFRIFAGAAAGVLFGTLSVSGLERQNSYQYDRNGASLPAPGAYTVERVWYAQDSGAKALNGATDLFAGPDGNLYIADAGNSRVLALDKDWKIVRELASVLKNGREEPLSEPQGVFKGTDGLLYICDTGNRRVIAVDAAANVKREILGKDMVSVQDSYDFKPERVAVDSLGNIYVSSSAVYQGIMRFSPEDHFQSFFAPNEVKRTLGTWLLSLLKSLFSDAQKDASEKSLPHPYNNLFIDNDFVYTTAAGTGESGNLKKNNLMGVDILQSAGKAAGGLGDAEIILKNGKALESALTDVHVDAEGVISIIDSNTNRIYQYTQECDLIAIFGGSGDNKGQFAQVSALEKRDGSYLVLDRQNGSVTVFSPAPYIGSVRRALALYNDGRYSEAEALWKEVLRENNNMTLAYKGIGRAALQQDDFKKAMEYLDKGADKYFYSMAFREYRKSFVRRYALFLVPGAAAVLALLWLSARKLRRYLLSGKGGV